MSRHRIIPGMDKYWEKIGMTRAAALEIQAKNILDRRNSSLPNSEEGQYLYLRDGKDYCGCGLVHVKVNESLEGCEDPGHTVFGVFSLSTLIYLSQKAQMVCQVWQGHRDSCALTAHQVPLSRDLHSDQLRKQFQQQPV